MIMATHRQQATPKRRRTGAVTVCALVAALVVSGCGNIVSKDNRQTYGGFYFPVKTAAVDKKTQPETFVVRVSRASQSVEHAAQAAHHEGVRYCVSEYGPHFIDWVVNPLEDPAALTIANDTLTVQGTCIS